MVVIIKHAHTKTSRIHTRLGSVTKPPGPVTHGIQDYKLTEPSVGCRKLLYPHFKLQADEREVSVADVSSVRSVEHADSPKFVILEGYLL